MTQWSRPFNLAPSMSDLLKSYAYSLFETFVLSSVRSHLPGLAGGGEAYAAAVIIIASEASPV